VRVAITTLGCKVNQYDTAVMERLFDEKGWTRVDFSESADAYVVNTCTVTDRADADARRMARRARRTNGEARVILTGCYAQTSPGKIAELDYVDYVIGLGRLPDLLLAVAGEMNERVAVSDLRKARTVDTLGIETFPGRSRAFVKVQEGCDLFCTFCIIPVARGRSRSVPPRKVIDEIARLEARGYREVVLTGIHLGGYGSDLDPPCDLAFLLEAIVERRPRLRVRISSVDPPEITDRLLDVVASSPVFCRHFHVPVQAGDDAVLARMRRRYSAGKPPKQSRSCTAAFPTCASEPT
jgi:threonylcarbamoyladenosine tRNA methylthiotransferase MtaB